MGGGNGHQKRMRGLGVKAGSYKNKGPVERTRDTRTVAMKLQVGGERIGREKGGCRES